MHRHWSRWLPCCLLGLWALVFVHPYALAGDAKKEQKPDPAKGTTGKPILSIASELTDKDGRDPIAMDCYCKIHPIKLEKDRTYQIDLRSKDFDAFLRLEDPSGKPVAEDDDSGGDLNARITYKAAKSGEHKIFATTFRADATGKYTLTVIEVAGEKKVAAGPAPKAIELKVDAGKPATFEGQLTAADPKDREGKHFKLFTISLQANIDYRIYMKGNAQVDAFVRLEDQAGKLIREDEAGEQNDSEVKFAPGKPGVYRIIATTYKTGMTGNFTLTVTQQAGTKAAPVVKDGKAEPLNLVAGKPVTITGKLTDADPKDAQGRRFKAYSFQAQPGRAYHFEMAGQGGLDPDLHIDDAKGKTVKNEDYGDSKVSRISAFTVTQGGTYRVIATTNKPGMIGDYTLTAGEREPKAARADAMPPFQKVTMTEIVSELTADDGLDKEGRAFKIYTFQARPDKMYRVEMNGRTFDPQLRLEDAGGQRIKDEDFFEGRFSRLLIPSGKGSTFRIIASTAAATHIGSFSLSITEVEPRPVKAEDIAFERLSRISGKLTDQDGIDSEGKFFKAYTVKPQPGKAYRCEMIARTFDPFLRLEDDKGNVLKKEDFGDEKSSRLEFKADAKGGTFRLVATSFKPGQVGEFILTIAERDKPPPATPLVFQQGKAVSQSNLAVSDDTLGGGKHFKEYTFKGEAGKTYKIDLHSKAFDAYLYLKDEAGKTLAEDDDSGADLDSRIIYRAEKAGTYHIIATTFRAGEIGPFVLSVAVLENAKPLPLKLVGGKATIDGTLTKQDAMETEGKFYKAYALVAEKGKAYRVALTGKGGFDPYVRVEDDKGQLLNREDHGDGKVSRVTFAPPKPGTYHVVATSYKAGDTGDYTLLVSETDSKDLGDKKAKDKKAKDEKVFKDKEEVKVQPLKLENGKAAITSTLSEHDGLWQGKFYRAFAFQAEMGKAYRFEMSSSSKGLLPLLRIEDDNGKLLKEEDFFDDKLSRVFFKASQAGMYRVVATTYKAGMTGDFILSAAQVEVKDAAPQALKFDQGKVRVAGELNTTDAALPGGKLYKEYTFKGEPGKIYKIDLHSKAFDAYLYLKDSTGKTLDENDDADGDTLDSRVVHKVEKAGTYHIIATSLQGGRTGAFVLTVGEPNQAEKLMARVGDLFKGTLPHEECKQLVKELQKHFAGLGNKLSPEDADLALRIGKELELGDKSLAAETFKTLGSIFAASPNPRVASDGRLMIGAGKRLGLIGQTMVVKGTTVDGKEFDLARMKGKVVLVDFWATWCAPCRAELPNVKKLYEKYHTQGFEVIGISLDNAEKDLTAFLDKEKLPWPSIYKEANDLADDYGVFTIPLAVLVGRDGRVISLRARGAELDRLLEEQFGGKKKD
jgi:thiol-disulfide isomerase/thioredoxin